MTEGNGSSMNRPVSEGRLASRPYRPPLRFLHRSRHRKRSSALCIGRAEHLHALRDIRRSIAERCHHGVKFVAAIRTELDSARDIDGRTR